MSDRRRFRRRIYTPTSKAGAEDASPEGEQAPEEPATGRRRVAVPISKAAPKPAEKDRVGPEVRAMLPEGGILVDYVEWASEQSFTPPILHLGSILPVWAYELTTGLAGSPTPWELPWRGTQGAVQTFCIAPPAVGKSTGLRAAQAFHEELRERYLAGVVDPINRSPAWIQAEGSVQGLLEAVHDMYDDEREVSPAIFFHEEMSSLLDKGTQVIDALMQLFDPIPRVERHLREYRKMRQGGVAPPSSILRPAVSGVFCSTPSGLQRTLTAAHFEGGLVSRALFFAGEAPTVEEDDYDAFLFGEIQTTRDREGVLRRWTHLATHLTGLRARGGARMAPWQPKCKEILRPLIEKWHQASSTKEVVQAAELKRGINKIQTLASMYALSRGSHEVAPGDVLAASRVVEHSQSVVEHLGQSTAEDPVYRISERARAAVFAAGPEGISRYVLNRKHLRISSQMFDQVLDLLKESGEFYIGKLPTQGRPATRIVARVFLDEESNVISFRRTPDDEDPDV